MDFSREANEFDCFSTDKSESVYILLLSILRDGEHTVVVDASRKLAIDSRKEYALQLSTAAIRSSAGESKEYRAIIQGVRFLAK